MDPVWTEHAEHAQAENLPSQQFLVLDACIARQENVGEVHVNGLEDGGGPGIQGGLILLQPSLSSLEAGHNSDHIKGNRYKVSRDGESGH